MNPENREPISNAQVSQWPACPIWFWGTLGTKSAAERRYIMRSCYAAAVAVAWILIAFGLHFRPKPVILPLTAGVAGAVITWIAWEFRKYLLQLDELARRMQLEAIACTYLTGLVLAAWLGILAPLLEKFTHWPLSQNLLLIPLLYFLLEPVRAGWLYYLSRRY
jgi:hypothetical protein